MIENVDPGDLLLPFTLVYTIPSVRSFILINTHCTPKYHGKGVKKYPMERAGKIPW